MDWSSFLFGLAFFPALALFKRGWIRIRAWAARVTDPVNSIVDTPENVVHVLKPSRGAEQ